jgi:hypothetical protein
MIFGKHVSFAVDLTVDGRPMKLGYTGEIRDGQIALTVEVKETGRTYDMLAKKAHQELVEKLKNQVGR